MILRADRNNVIVNCKSPITTTTSSNTRHPGPLVSSRVFRCTVLAIIIIYSLQFGLVGTQVDTALRESSASASSASSSRLDPFPGRTNNHHININKNKNKKESHGQDQRVQEEQPIEQDQQRQEKEPEQQLPQPQPQTKRQQKVEEQPPKQRPQRQQELPVPKRKQKKKQQTQQELQQYRSDDHNKSKTSLANNPKIHQEISQPRQQFLAIPPTSINSTLPSRHEQDLVHKYFQQRWNRSFLPLSAVLEENDPFIFDAKPLPLRVSPKLTTISYPDHIRSCQDIPNNWPVGHAKEMDHIYGTNVGDLQSPFTRRYEYAQTTCPVDADPFLPWIHDVFVTASGRHVQFIAHNRRRCNRDPWHFKADIENLEPQVALLQSIPIQTLPVDQNHSSSSSSALPKGFSIPDQWKNTTRSDKEQWYRLAPLEEADESSKETRFLCQFFTLRPTYNDASSQDDPIVNGVEKVIVGETWSVYPYNYEHAHQRHRRGQVPKPMFSRPEHEKDVNGIHNEYVWNAILLFKCPIPSVVLQQQQQQQTADQPNFYLDLVPVRTPPRENVTGYNPPNLHLSKFNPLSEWGPSHIIPPVSQSGRWANIPICPIPMTPVQPKQIAPSQETVPKTNTETNNTIDTNVTKPYFIVGCVWASAVFSERGHKTWDTQTIERMLEWLTYHLEIAGFDHMVIYDNTAAHTDEISLKPVLDLFPPHQVTRIPWKHRVCNNNIYEHFNSGERSSQYAAEASCRERYGPMTEWMSFFDTDEYLIPSGNWSSIREWLQGGVANGSIGPETQILSLYETKASLNYRFLEPFVDDSVKECHSNCTTCDCLKKRKNATYLEAYCEPLPFPRPYPLSKQKMKQLYRPSFVLNHFVHYATVTNYVHTRPRHPRVVEWPVERRAIEFTEAYMVHTKTILPAVTSGWKANGRCRSPKKCPVGFPFPFYQDFNYTTNTTTPDNVPIKWHPQLNRHPINEMGIPYNCYELRKVKEDLGVRLHEILDPRKEKLDEVMANLKFFSALKGTTNKG